MNHQIITIFFLCLAAFSSISTVAQARETKMLKKKFGLELPKTAKTSFQLKTNGKIVYSMIEMPLADAVAFRKSLMRLPSDEERLVAVEDSNCKGQTCLGIGFLPIHSETPKAIKDWWQKRNAHLDLLVTITRYKRVKKIENGETRELLQGKGGAVIFFDSEQGLLWLYYND